MIEMCKNSGVMEDFSSLPRLYRDSAVNELWEGPRNVLLTQMHRDFQRAKEWYAPEDFVKENLKGADKSRLDELCKEMSEIISHPNIFQFDEKTENICKRWDAFCHNLYHAYQDLALNEVERS